MSHRIPSPTRPASALLATFTRARLHLGRATRDLAASRRNLHRARHLQRTARFPTVFASLVANAHADVAWHVRNVAYYARRTQA